MPTIADKPPAKRERALDDALDDSFPASDPPSISPQTTIRHDDAPDSNKPKRDGTPAPQAR